MLISRIILRHKQRLKQSKISLVMQFSEFFYSLHRMDPVGCLNNHPMHLNAGFRSIKNCT